MITKLPLKYQNEEKKGIKAKHEALIFVFIMMIVHCFEITDQKVRDIEYSCKKERKKEEYRIVNQCLPVRYIYML